tara:strand:- start:341 stop:646 length:306 start_codon:yes stop_codon:yes gene_type:complete
MNFFVWLSDEGAIEYADDNVVYADRAFMANSVLHWCAKKARRRELNDKQIKEYAHIIRYFIHNKVDIWWEKGTINIGLTKKGDKIYDSYGMEDTEPYGEYD